MGREKKRSGPGMGPGGHAKERHKKKLRTQVLGAPATTVLNARPEIPNLKSKHISYYEIVENTDKKKKLEFQITSKKTPPPGFEFVPIGNPELTTACKELSREQDAMIFIVSNNAEAGSLSQQTNRIGHHIRQAIVEEARKEVSDGGDSSDGQNPPGIPEPIPKTQEEINEQADLAIRDLFPRIPHTDRQMIIEHSFKKGATKKGEPLVGLAQDIPLSRRVQLAVLAHIRHTHTRYDKLLKETTYVNARRTVERLCLDVLVKWRGDEETGRDQLDEILREVIVISDSEGEDDGGGEDDEADSSGVESGDLAREPSYLPYPTTVASQRRIAPRPVIELRHPQDQGSRPQWHDESIPGPSQPLHSQPYARPAVAVKRARRGFKRYEAALAARWDEAIDRVRHQEDHPLEHPVSAVEYPPYTRYEPLLQEQRPSPGAFYPGGAQDTTLYHRGAHNSNPQPLELPAQGPIPVLSAAAVPHRSLSGGLSRSNSPYTDSRRTHPPQRVLVRSGEARDFLVPSIEPLSPSTEPQPFYAAPVFVRTVSPRQASRPPRDFAGDVPDQFDAHHSPTWGGGGPASFKRRRVMDGEPYPLRGSPHPEPGPNRRLVHDERRQRPVHYAEVQPNDITPQTPLERDPRTHFAHPPVQPLARIPISQPEDRSYYAGHMVEPPLGSVRAAPIVIDNWVRQPSPVVAAYPVRDYRGNVVPERREPPHMIEHGEEARHQQVVEYRRHAPAGYDAPPGHRDMSPFIQYRPTQDMLPIHSGHIVDRREAYDHGQSPFAGSTETRPTGYQPPDYAPPRFQHQGDHVEPAAVFVRHVERFEQPFSDGTYEHPGEQYNQGTLHDFQAPRPNDGAWAQSRAIAPPHSPKFNAAGAYPLYITELAEPQPGDPMYRGYSEHHNQQYNQRGL